jgi:hypothetical protein
VPLSIFHDHVQGRQTVPDLIDKAEVQRAAATDLPGGRVELPASAEGRSAIQTLGNAAPIAGRRIRPAVSGLVDSSRQVKKVAQGARSIEIVIHALLEAASRGIDLQLELGGYSARCRRRA